MRKYCLTCVGAPGCGRKGLRIRKLSELLISQQRGAFSSTMPEDTNIHPESIKWNMYELQR